MDDAWTSLLRSRVRSATRYSPVARAPAVPDTQASTICGAEASGVFALAVANDRCSCSVAVLAAVGEGRRERRLTGLHVAVRASQRDQLALRRELSLARLEVRVQLHHLREVLARCRGVRARVEVAAHGPHVQVAGEQHEQHRAEPAGALASQARGRASASVGHAVAFGGAARPPACGTLLPVLAERDLADAERQLGRTPRALVRVAARCPYGRPSVLVQGPYDDAGTPFPTLYWLSCPALAQAIGRLEGEDGVARLTAALAADDALALGRRETEARVRATRCALPRPATLLDAGAALAAGIAGEAPGGGLKCLHAHAAAALADPPYRLGELVLELASARYPAGCCSG